MSPAESVIKKFGGVRATARAVGLSPGAVCRWPKPRIDGGCGGEIPTRNHRKIMEAARNLNISIEPAELVCAG